MEWRHILSTLLIIFVIKINQIVDFMRVHTQTFEQSSVLAYCYWSYSLSFMTLNAIIKIQHYLKKL